MKKYKIIESVYYNEKGETNAPKYYIKELKPIIPFFGWMRWVYIKETHCGWGDYYKVRMKWNTVEDAQNFITEILCPQTPRDTHKYTEIKTVNCND
jgi:hypothetical protein